MDLMTIFPNLNVMWPRWSEYEVKEHDDIEYLVPTSTAVMLTGSCAESPELLVAEALELGRQFRTGSPDRYRLCAVFAARHGLLGIERGGCPPSEDEQSVPPYCHAWDSREYGEPLDRLNKEFQTLYCHFLQTMEETPPPVYPEVFVDLLGTLEYRLTGGRTPQLVWNTYSLLAVLHLAYSMLITEKRTSLKVCKNCGKVYYNPHAKSEFCGTKCRNYYNVKAFREREKK